MTQVVVLGAGMVGSVIATDLAKQSGYSVLVADRSDVNLAAASARAAAAGARIETVVADLSQRGELERLAGSADVVVGALASHLGFQALNVMADLGKKYADISFMAEDMLPVNERAKQTGAVCVVDCGVAPGMSNLLCGYGVSLLDEAEELEIYVGGLPVERTWPWDYKAGFAPADVLEEYTRPSRIVERGEVVIKEALSEPELMHFEGVGTLEAFHTDGLRSLADTLSVPMMKERTLRYSGHIELMRVLRHLGLFSKQAIEVDGQMVVPLSLTSKLLFPQWTYEEGEADLTVMRILVRGKKRGLRVEHRWDLLDHYHPGEKATSMSRTTGLPCAIVARMLAEDRYTEAGVHPPEDLGPVPGVLEHVLSELSSRGVEYRYAETVG
ncbi:MAG: saccharopine reductase [Planctomycetota bacterium]|nr:MAG: saccharopine reductase [Planctomycetota bacterium]